MMGTAVPETCWAYKKHNKIISDILLVFHSSTVWKVYVLREEAQSSLMKVGFIVKCYE